MLNFLYFLLILIQASWALEPERILVVSNGNVQSVEFKNLKSVETLTLNYHPNFIKLGKIHYKGFKVSEVLKKVKLNPEDSITIVGNTGQFSVELRARELTNGNNIIATHANGKAFTTDGNGLQIIYDEETLKKYPLLKERQFWCWWVRSFITDEKFKLKNLGTKKTLITKLPWPVPYGISSLGMKEIKSRDGIFLQFKKLRVELLNGNEKEIVADQNSSYFLANPISNKSGAYSLHQLIESNGDVQTFLSNLYYIKSVKVIQ
jgi:hypothetical protein